MICPPMAIAGPVANRGPVGPASPAQPRQGFSGTPKTVGIKVCTALGDSNGDEVQLWGADQGGRHQARLARRCLRQRAQAAAPRGRAGRTGGDAEAQAL
jgi:hypothetical protein